MEKPILFSTEMVKAILAGRKTMTRRVIKPQPKGQLKCVIQHETSGRSCWMEDNADQLSKDFKFHKYYEVGDILWVRETFCYDDFDNGGETIYFKADYTEKEGKELFTDLDLKWKPSIFMPRSAARLFLKVKNIRVERLQDITEEDAIAEGCDKLLMETRSARNNFMNLWNFINTKRGYIWAMNNWVWVVEFERVEA